MTDQRDARAVLVTGGAGYIGSHACKALHRSRYLPVTVDDLSRGHRELVRWGPFVHGSVADAELLDGAFARYRPVAVFHFAAFAYVGESVGAPGLYYSNNVGGTISLLQAMQRHKVTTLVFSSSCSTYGVPTAVPVTEHHPLAPVSPYGRSKAMVEQILQDFNAAHGLRYVSLRYFNAAGDDPEGETGEIHDPETHIIPAAINVALGNQRSLRLFGTDYPTPDGSAVRDYIHVTDIAEAHVKALQYLNSGGASICLNLGTGKGSSVREVVRAVERQSGRTVNIDEQPRRPGDPPLVFADAARAREVLGWVPLYSDLQTIVQTAWNWHSSRK